MTDNNEVRTENLGGLYRPHAFVDLAREDVTGAAEPDLRSVIDAKMREAIHEDMCETAGVQPALTVGDAREKGALTADGGWCVEKNAITFVLSREEAIGWGLVEPTEEEAADLAAQREEWRRRRNADVRLAWQTYDEAREQLAAIADDDTAHAVLALHKPEEYVGEMRCDGCEGGGYDRQAPAWPCATVSVIARMHDVALPDPDDLDMTYDRESGGYRRAL